LESLAERSPGVPEIEGYSGNNVLVTAISTLGEKE
jgi:hypothetical protein